MVGFGRIADSLADSTLAAQHYTYASHAQILSSHPGLHWLGVADPAVGARTRAAQRWGVPHIAADARELAAMVAPEILVLACPPERRLDALRAFPSVRAVLVEKPLGTCLADARAFVAYCDDNRIKTGVNLLRRADTTFQALAAGGLTERIGAAQAVTVIYGNGLRNNGCHLIDLLRQFFGPIATVHAIGPTQPLPDAAIAGDVAVPFSIRFDGGPAVVALPIDFRHYRENAIDIWGTTGRLSLSQETLCLRHFETAPHRQVEDTLELRADISGTPLPSTLGTAFMNMYDNLLAALDTGAQLFAPAGDVLETERYIDAILASAEQGCVPRTVSAAP
ncbi:MAG: Gfo/Idh/MocA family protein [Alphaproteobacteria bacterium]